MNISYKAISNSVHALKLSDVNIGKLKTDISIDQVGCESTGLSILFGCGFDIHIHPEYGMKISREFLRPRHDHNDTEYLCIHRKNKTTCWLRSDCIGNDHEIFYIQFGPRQGDD